MPKDENKKTPTPSSKKNKIALDEEELWDLDDADWDNLENNDESELKEQETAQPDPEPAEETNEKAEDTEIEEADEEESEEADEEEHDSFLPPKKAPQKKASSLTLVELEEEEDDEGDDEEEDYDESFFDEENEPEADHDEIEDIDTSDDDLGLFDELEDDEEEEDDEVDEKQKSIPHRSFKKETTAINPVTAIKHRSLEEDIDDIEDFDDFDDLDDLDADDESDSEDTEDSEAEAIEEEINATENSSSNISTEWDDDEISTDEDADSTTSKTTIADLLEEEETLHPIENDIVEPENRSTLLEKISILACILSLLTIAFIAFTYFRKETTVGTSEQTGKNNTTLPVTGEQITITHVDSYWVRPSDKTPYKIKAGTDLAPLCIIKGELNGTGCLRLFFKDNEGNTVGDALNLSFEKGKFKASGKDYVKISATSGLENEIDFSLITGGQEDPWSVTIFEGPSDKASATQFIEIAHLPINSHIGE